MGQRQAALERAIAALDAQADLRVRRQAPWFETEPVGLADQPWFLNTVIEVQTVLGPRALLGACQVVEAALGRRPRARWGPREIDVDVLLYGAWVIAEPGLCVPHAQLGARAFVLVPLLALLPEGVEPRTGVAFRALAARLDDDKKVRPFLKRS